MAVICCHCRSADVMHGFDTFQCLSCGKITSGSGHPLLPDSLHTSPNHDAALTQFGWPFADAAEAVARGEQIVAEQWGVPFPLPSDAVPPPSKG